MDEYDEVGGEADQTNEGDEGNEGGDEDDEMDLEEEEGKGPPLEREEGCPPVFGGQGVLQLEEFGVDRLILDFHIPSSFVIYTPVPQVVPLPLCKSLYCRNEVNVALSYP
ncbi:UNVERIFIED_CONTAM: hypothetical protein Sradi_5740400 [Sesamum radiatum]|uniref:Uncharacterized protein n=1 Tax=Sesamum radiatum TaxID=300843 RepID=A0AAW2L2C0_SESRA